MAASIPSASRRFLKSGFLSLPGRSVFLKKRTSLLPFLAIGAALLSLPAKAALPSRVFAPYIQMNTQSLTSVSQASGIKYFTLAFIIDNGSGQGTWEAGTSVASDTSIAPSISALRSAGGDVIISFGGAAGNELAIGITNVSTLQSVYQGIINKYNVKALDFDIEGSALDNTSANDRRNQALAGLQSANPGLFISYTLPVTPTGLLSNSIALLQNAKSHGVNVACVNIMAMDYGSSTSPSMGQDAINASNGTISQLSANGLTTSVGITVLIGNQDTSPEVFTLNDAQTTENYAVGQSQVNRVAFWEVARDQCGSSCSGVSQNPWDFSHIFEPFSGGGTTSEGPFGGTPAAIPGTVQAENYDTGGQGVAYNIGSVNGTDNGYRSDGVDLEVTSDTGGGVDLGWTFGGDWFKYTVNVATAGTYTVSFRVAGGAGAVTDAFHLSNASGTNLSGNVNVPNTGGWQTWTTVTANVTLPAGQQILTINQDNGGWNINYVSFASSVVTVATPVFSPSGGTYGAAQNVTISDSTGGASIRYTLDGSTPTSTTGTLYSGPVNISSTATLKAVGYKSGDTTSAVASATYTINSSEGPFGGTPAAIPGTVQAENYDTGGQGVAYNIGSINGTDNGYRSDGVDLELTSDTGGGVDLGWTFGGDWFKYTVNVATAGTYTVSFRIAAPAAVTDAFHLANSSGTNLSGNVNLPATGGYQNWATVTANVTLPAGQQVLTLDQDNGGWNINYASFASQTVTFTITASAGSGGSISPSGSVGVNQGANQSFTITPNSGFNVSSVTVDGSNQGAITSYTFSNVQANHTISATFSSSGGGRTLTGSSGNGWHALAISPAATGTFTATYDATPSISPENAVVGLSNGAATTFGNLGCIARFNPSGDIDAYNGTAYAAASTIPYSANVSYHFRLVVNVTAHTYSVFVTPSGGSEITVGSNYAFRSTANTMTSLNDWNLFVDSSIGGASLTANNLTP
jgi:hypothetical protein